MALVCDDILATRETFLASSSFKEGLTSVALPILQRGGANPEVSAQWGLTAVHNFRYPGDRQSRETVVSVNESQHSPHGDNTVA